MANRRDASGHEALSVALLVSVTAAWGTTFLLVKNVTQSMSIMGFLTARFGLASVALVSIRPRSVARITRRTGMRGTLLGLALTCGYICQTASLRYTSAAISGFLMGLCVVFTPLFAWPLLRQRISASTSIAVAISMMGLGVLSIDRIDFGLGEALSIFGAMCFALQIVGLGAWSKGEDAYALTLVQLVTVSLCCAIGTAPHFAVLPHGTFAWFGVLATAIVATALAFVVQTWAQTYISPTRTAIIFTLEPVVAGITSWLGGEHLSWGTLGGGAMVVFAMLIAELGYRERKLQGD